MDAYYAAYVYDLRFMVLGRWRVLVIGLAMTLMLWAAFLLTNNSTLDAPPPRSGSPPGQPVRRTSSASAAPRPTGLCCSTCHGSPHALYPAQNPYGKGHDVIQPCQYYHPNRPAPGAGALA